MYNKLDVHLRRTSTSRMYTIIAIAHGTMMMMEEKTQRMNRTDGRDTDTAEYTVVVS